VSCAQPATSAAKDSQVKTANSEYAGLRVFLCLSFVIVVSLHAPATGASERWWGVAVGADYVNFDPMPVVSLATGLWPEDKKFGYQAYLEYADPSCDNTLWTVAGEALWRLHRFYFGGGLALSNERLCDQAGTKWNFSLAIGARITKHLDVQWRHRSHGSDLGIDDGTSNVGINLIELRWRTNWRE
jgi:hypothetical protein